MMFKSVFWGIFLTGLFNGTVLGAVDGFKIDASSRSFDVLDVRSGQPLFAQASAGLQVDGKWAMLRSLTSEKIENQKAATAIGQGQATVWRLTDAAKQIRFGLELIEYPHSEWLTINAWVENLGKSKIALDAVRLIDADKGFLSDEHSATWRVLCGDIDSLKWTGETLNDEKNAIQARTLTAFWNSVTNKEAVLGFSITKAWGNFVLRKSGDGLKLNADVKLDVDVLPGETYCAEPLHIKTGDVLNAMEELITLTGRQVGARTDGTSFGGWCSWYGFNPFIDKDITEDIVIDLAKAAEQHKDELPMQLVLLDDGYFTLPGDWTTLRPFFPNGMPYLAGEIAKRNLIPGIWIAPSIVHENAEILRQHPEWMERLKNGSPKHYQGNWGGNTRSFDVSNPQVLEHIDGLIKTVCGQWGYQYLKLDFNIEPGPNRYDRRITPFEAIRNMYKTIRKAAGPEVFLAACTGNPFPPSVGIAQAGRVGPDVNPQWDSVLKGCNNSLLAIPFHRRWWVNDPDCLNMRKDGSQLTDAEVQTHLTANFMGGGYVLFSDGLAELPADRLQMFAQALPSYGVAAKPIGYMKSPGNGIPHILNLPIEKHGEKYAVVALFNWQDEPLDIPLTMTQLGLDAQTEYHVFEFWTDAYKGVFKESLNIAALPPHGCYLLAVKPVMEGQIQVVSSDLHLLQGTMEIVDIVRMNTSPFSKAKAEIWIALEPVSVRSGKLVLAAQDGLKIVAMQGGKAELSKRKDGLWNLKISDLKNKAAVGLRVR